MVTQQVIGRVRFQNLVDLVPNPTLSLSNSSKHLLISPPPTPSPSPLFNLNADPEYLIHLHIN